MMNTQFLRGSALAGLIFLAGISMHAAGQSLSSIKTDEDKINVAVLTLKNAEGVTVGEAEIISDRLRAELFNTGRVNIMERDQMQAVLKEQGFQQSGACTDEACMVEIGKLLGVKQLVTGSIGKLGSIFLVNVRVVDVSSGKIVKVLSRDLNGMDVVVGHLPGISKELVGQTKAQPSADAETRSVAAAPKQESQPAAAPVIQATPVEETTLSSRDDLNRNRFGIHLGYNLYIGETWIYTDNRGKLDTLNYTVNSVARRPVQQPNINLILALGPVITMDIGAGFAFWGEDLTGTREGGQPAELIMQLTDSLYPMSKPINSLTFNHLSIPVMAGLNIAVRAYPLKITFGPTFSYNPMWVFITAKDSTGATLGKDPLPIGPMVSEFTYALTLGGKFGLELMLGKHVGLGADFLFRGTLIRPEFQVGDLTITERMPFLGAGMNLNFYF